MIFRFLKYLHHSKSNPKTSNSFKSIIIFFNKQKTCALNYFDLKIDFNNKIVCIKLKEAKSIGKNETHLQVVDLILYGDKGKKLHTMKPKLNPKI